MTIVRIPRLLTAKDVAKRCAVSERTIRREISAGHLRAVRVRGALRVLDADAAKYLENLTKQVAS